VQTEELEKPPVPEEVIRERILFPSGLMPAMRELAAMQNIAQKRDRHSMPINLFIIVWCLFNYVLSQCKQQAT
jgi:hypothetical protein